MSDDPYPRKERSIFGNSPYARGWRKWKEEQLAEQAAKNEAAGALAEQKKIKREEAEAAKKAAKDALGKLW